jgi:phosphosulfolactate phosphohydrolase-like enzyme
VAFGWGSSAAVCVVVTVVGSNGALTTYYADLAVGGTTTITVPEGATAVTLARPVRQRVRLGERGGRSVGRN